MFKLGNKSPQKAGTLALSLAVVLSMLLWTGGAGTAAVSAQAAAAEPTTVAQSPAGSVVSNIVRGTTASGLDVTGYFTPLKFRRVGDQMRVRGLVSGTIHRADGAIKTFDVMRTMRVRSITQTGPATAAKAGQAVQAAAVCDILHLVLGPLDLNLLGLRIQLNQVVLDITAITGALLGDLLCAISGLLSGGLLGQLRDLLNQILGRLGLGL